MHALIFMALALALLSIISIILEHYNINLMRLEKLIFTKSINTHNNHKKS